MIRWKMYKEWLENKGSVFGSVLRPINATAINRHSLMLRFSIFTSIVLLLSACGGGGSSQPAEPLSDDEILGNLNLSDPISYNNKVASSREKRLQIEIEFANTRPITGDLRLNILIDSDGSGDESTHDFFVQLDNPYPCASGFNNCYSSKTESVIFGSYDESADIYRTRFLSNLSYGATEDSGNLKVILGLHIFTKNEEELLIAGNAKYLVKAIVSRNLVPGTGFQSIPLSSDSYPDNGYILMSDRYELDVERDYAGNDSSADIRAVRVTNLLDNIQ